MNTNDMITEHLMDLPDGVLAALASDEPQKLYLPQGCNGLNDLFLVPAVGSIGSPGSSSPVKQPRTLLMIACELGALHCVINLIQLGASVSVTDGPTLNTALHLCCAEASNNTANVTKLIAALIRAGASMESQNADGKSPKDLLNASLTMEKREGANDSPAGPKSLSSLEAERYKTDDFRMYHFKIETCPYLDVTHDWTDCPYLHPNEKARRRDPRIYRYLAIPCPDFRKNSCKRGDSCPYAHGVFEAWLHPSKYRTQLCNEGACCPRSVCFFAHSVHQLRDQGPEVCLPALDNGSPKSPRGMLGSGATSSQPSRCSSPSLNDAALAGANDWSIMRAHSFDRASTDSHISTGSDCGMIRPLPSAAAAEPQVVDQGALDQQALQVWQQLLQSHAAQQQAAPYPTANSMQQLRTDPQMALHAVLAMQRDLALKQQSQQVNPMPSSEGILTAFSSLNMNTSSGSPKNAGNVSPSPGDVPCFRDLQL